MSLPRCLWLWLLTGVAIAPVRGEDPLPHVERLKSSPVLRHLQPNPRPEPARSPAEQTLGLMHVPEGFHVELIAAEPSLSQPVAFTFDERGRLWVAEAHSYPQKRPAGQGLDRILVFEDADGDGRFETRKVFTQGLNLVSGLEVGHGGLWVGAAPELLFIADANKDDVPDGPPRVLLDGFGFQDTHECLNSFMWGPDGWLYGNQGVFNYARIGRPGAPAEERVELRAGVWRYHPARHQFEVFAHGGSNPWGLDYDAWGRIFMTHCRSYWGKGLTTHVVQGGHYWNQANANHAPFIIGQPPSGFPEYRNYLLASARYDHGAGGAGPPGSDAIYGGHSHVGTMIYLGDNWPDEYRGRLFTHNLHGHQINQQINQPLGSGCDTVHAGQDVFFCSDPKYVAVDLQYGPDGAVYIIDWYDQQHCHNPNTERWERGSGRIYRMQYQPAYKPVRVNLGAMSDLDLAGLLDHKNHWHSRTARRLLQERAAQGAGVSAQARSSLETKARQDPDPLKRLRALWALHAIAALTDAMTAGALADPDEQVRGWAVQLAAEDHDVAAPLLQTMTALAAKDPSPVVRLFLASAIQRVPDDGAWNLITALAGRAEDAEDRNVPLLLWQGLAQRIPGRLKQSFELAGQSKLPRLADHIAWYAATLEGEGLNLAAASLAGLDGPATRRRLAGLELALRSQSRVPMPPAWKDTAPALVSNADPGVARAARRLAAVFGDDSMFPKLRETLARLDASAAERQEAFAILSRAQDRASLPVFLGLLAERDFRARVIDLLGRFDDPEVSRALLGRFGDFSEADQAAALSTLTGRPSFALALLDAVAAGQVKRERLTSFHVRRLQELRHAEVDRRVTTAWGAMHRSPAEKEALIRRLEKVFNEAPLWAYSAGEGQKHFRTLCASCHRLRGEGTLLGPDLTGAGANGIRYFLENIIDPNAVIGADFQMTVVETKGQDTISGLLAGETAGAVTLRTTLGESVIAKEAIARRTTSEASLMPEGLIEPLKEREQLELLKFLVSQ